MRADPIAVLRHEVAAVRRGVGQVAVLIGEIEVVVLHHRLRHQEVERLVAVDRKRDRRQDDEPVDQQRHERRSVRRPADVAREGDEGEEHGQLQHAKGDDDEASVDRDAERAGKKNRRAEEQPGAELARGPLPQGPAAQEEQRRGDGDDGERHERHSKSTDSTCRRALAGRSGAALMCSDSAPGTTTKPAP